MGSVAPRAEPLIEHPRDTKEHEGKQDEPVSTAHDFYFSRFEQRRPEAPIPHSALRETLWQFLATMSLVFGGWYIVWRWGWSLNYGALWFALPLVIAETCAYIGLVLFTFNLWQVEDYPQQPPPELMNDCLAARDEHSARPISVDVFFPTYNEDPELVRLSIRDAKAITYPHPVHIQIHVLDDGQRPAMQKVAEEEGVNYITRPTNIGFKAGNLRNAMELTSGDFLVICDADTRPFPTILENTLGYFRDPDVAWVQTPQWFFDIPEGRSLPRVLHKKFGEAGTRLGALIERWVGPVKVGADPFGSDPKLFYDIILRRRNWANASFCCGAGSIHRREAVMEAGLKAFGQSVDLQLNNILAAAQENSVTDEASRENLAGRIRSAVIHETELTPYKFHVSEDIYTSIVLHSDPDRNWKSVLHPQVESKMLSPQDLQSWMVQRFKYAGGTFDIALHDSPLFRPGMSWAQKLMYATTFWSYLGCVWNAIFLLAPLIFLFTGVPPVTAYDADFYKHLVPFLFCNALAFMIGTWGASNWDGQASYLYSFPLQIRALWTVLRGEKIRFPVTPKGRQEGNFFSLVLPQFFVVLLTIAALIFGTIQIARGVPLPLGALLANAFWGLNNILALQKVVRAAFWAPEQAE